MFLVTPRLLLRPPWGEDAAAIVAAMEWDIARMTSSMPWPYTLADAHAFLARPRPPEASARAASFSVVTRGEGRLVGGAGFGDNLATGELEFGYWLARAVWGRGYATEAAAALLAFGFGPMRLSEIVAGHFEDNPVSGRVLAKLGMTPTGRVFDYPSKARGGAAPSPEYRLTRAQWLAARPGWAIP
jgi:RimJ/RimL family protein N-acetyltransferase